MLRSCDPRIAALGFCPERDSAPVPSWGTEVSEGPIPLAESSLKCFSLRSPRTPFFDFLLKLNEVSIYLEMMEKGRGEAAHYLDARSDALEVNHCSAIARNRFEIRGGGEWPSLSSFMLLVFSPSKFSHFENNGSPLSTVFVSRLDCSFPRTNILFQNIGPNTGIGYITSKHFIINCAPEVALSCRIQENQATLTNGTVRVPSVWSVGW